MAKNNNKINKNAIAKEQHKGQILVFIGYVLTFAFMILAFFHKILIASIPLLSFVILFIYAYATLKNLKFSLRYLIILVVFFLAMFTSMFSIFLTPASIANVSEALVIATTISFLIDLEFYKHMKEYILKVLRNQNTKQSLFTAIDTAFVPMMASTFALVFALVALMVPLLPFSILLIDISIFLILIALIMPIELLAEDLLTVILNH